MGRLYRSNSPGSKHKPRLPRPPCVRCGLGPVVEWYKDPEQRLGLCLGCIRGPKRKREREHMPVYREFADVNRKLPYGTLIRILGNPEPWWDGVYRIKNGGAGAQGFVWGTRVFPGPFQSWGVAGPRPRELRPWGPELPPEYTIPGLDDQ